MHTTGLLASVLPVLRAIPPRAVVLIDGPSGAGKSTLADEILTAWPGMVPPTLVRLDDIYPGWDGLDAAIEQVTRHLLEPRVHGRPAAWQRFDWARGVPSTWHTVDADRPLVIEGCGSLARAHQPFSDVRIWVDADDTVRKQRALRRDGELFRAHWDRWQEQWDRYLHREDPRNGATVCVSAAPGIDAVGTTV